MAYLFSKKGKFYVNSLQENKMPIKTAKNRHHLMVPGFRAAGVACGLKKTGALDLALIISDTKAEVAGVFTKNKVKAAPVLLDIKRVKKGVSRGVIVNSGNANVSAGRAGVLSALRMAAAVEKGLGLKSGEILVASTGVIGVMPAIEKIEAGAPGLIRGLSSEGLTDAAQAIMTTDAFEKTATARGRIHGKTVTVAGIAKGAGMICPDMATMLSFIMTDANIRHPALRKALKEAVDLSFNSIAVDNDTSTNDTVLIFANGVSNGSEIKSGTADFKTFCKMLNEVALKLAHLIVKDGEGATKFIEIDIKGAATTSDAKKAAKTIATSMLVKTAFFGADPNWGRIMAALGRAGIRMKEDRVDITLNGVPVARGGMDTGKEKEAAKVMKEKEVNMTVNLGAGKAAWRFWTTDLTYEYVKINSAYRT